MAIVPQLKLNNGIEIPQLGFGVFRVPPQQTQQSVEAALAAGYRHIDTAASYGNEAEVGKAIAAAGLPREELFLTTKLPIPGQEKPEAAFEASRTALGVEYIDLYLIHWPAPARNLYVGVWQLLEEIYAGGLVRAIGVSNFLVHHLEALFAGAGVVPAVNQIELHPTLQQREVAAASRSHGIAVEAYSPLGQGTDLSAGVVHSLADRHNATPAQIVLAWNLHQGNIVITKTIRAERLQENLGALEITLGADDIAALNSLEAGNRIASHPDRKS